MITEKDISRKCYGQTFSRARTIADNGSLVSSRRCSYATGYTELRANVESSSYYYQFYDVWVLLDEESGVLLDEESGAILDHDCSCPAHSKYSMMCKHAAALALLYSKKPETFKGYRSTRPTVTSPSISNFMKRMNTAAAPPKAVSEQQPGTVSLELSVSPQAQGRWAAEFRIACPGASYIVRSITDLLEDVRSGVWRQYGKKLAFTHTREAFTEQAWQVLQWLQRVTSAGTDC